MKRFLAHVGRDRQYLYLLIPGTLFFLIYCYLPMVGVLLAFTNYRGGDLWRVKLVGLKWFVQFVTAPDFARLLRNTVLLNLLNIIFMFSVTIFFSLMLNEVKSLPFKKLAQTASYLPYFISTVIIVGILYNFLAIEGGLVNELLSRMGREKINFISSAKWFRTLYVGSNVWQYFGMNSIIYISAIASINIELYEAAEVDGANRIQRIIHITLPGLYPTIMILLILNLGSLFTSGFEKVILMYSPATYETADVIGSYVYRRGVQGNDFAYGTAIGLMNSVINLIWLWTFNRISRRLTSISLW